MSIQKLLNSSLSREKVQGLRTILSTVADGGTAQAQVYFADVVKLVFERDLEIRELAAAYLVMFSHTEPELTLMIVNAVQKMLHDPSAVIRVQALRLAAALRVPTVAPIVVHLINETGSDPNWLVRAACCQAIGTCYEIDPSLGPELLEILQRMLVAPRQQGGDFAVAGWALAILARHWPQRIDLLHSMFRIYVPHLAKFEEWCQIAVCPMLLRYCRHFLTGPNDPDSQLLVQSVKPLLFSLNTAVVVESVAVLLYVGTPDELPLVVDRLLGLPPSALVWSSIAVIASRYPHLLADHRSNMISEIVLSHDPLEQVHALQTISLCSTQELTKPELSDLQLCALAWQNNHASLRAVMSTISSLVGPSLIKTVIEWHMKLATDQNQSPALISESLMSLRVLIQQHDSNSSVILPKLVKKMAHIVLTNKTLLASAKATIIWLVSVYCSQIPHEALELLRQLLLHDFPGQSEAVRSQTVELAAKLSTAHKNNPSAFDLRLPQLVEYAMSLAKFDPSIDIRDRARLFVTLNNSDRNMATLLLQAAQPAPKSLFGAQVAAKFMIGTLSQYFGKPMDGYMPLENWSTEDTSNLRVVTDSIIQENLSEAPNNSTRKMAKPVVEKVKEMSLEEFLNEPRKSSETGSISEQSEIMEAEKSPEKINLL